MKMHKLSVIVPVHNGESYVRKNLEEMRRSLSEFIPDYEIIAVIDGAKDNSYQVASKVPGVKVVGYKRNMGKGFALKYGFKHVTGDVVTFVDADMDLHPSQLINFFPYLATADLVIGSKRHPFSKLEYPLTRQILSKAYQLVSLLVLGVNLRDTQSGLKLIKKDVLDIIMPLLVVKRYAFDLEMCFLAQRHGFRIVEAPVSVTFKHSSSLTTRAAWRMLLDTLAVRYRYSFMRHYQRAFHEAHFKKKETM
jgi:glycosyltransferase involved in cell wall biosynthesis